MAEMQQETNTEQETSSAITRRNLLKGLIAGAAGGVVGAGVKLICEQIAPPRAPGREPPPGILVSNILQARRGYGLDHAGKQKSAMVIHWTFSILSSAAYGAAAEFFPWVTAGYGALYGWAVWAGTHESVLPLLKLTPPLSQVPASEQINEFISHGIFGVSVEATRRFVRKQLK